LYSRDNSDAQSSNASALEFVVLVADCISVILAESDELGFSEEEALQIAAGYVSEVVPILMKGPWPPSTASTILQAASRIELEQVADKLRRLATVCNF
jgi:hypothetical protein